MQSLETKLNGLGHLGTSKSVVSTSCVGTISTDYLTPASKLPLVIRPVDPDLDLIAWARENRRFLDERLQREGAILFRNFSLRTPPEFESLIEAVSGKLLDYSYRSTPRSLVSGHIYTSTEYPAHQSIPLHNENSYSLSWPMKLWFFSLEVAPAGGETPIVDSRRVYQRIPPEIRECFDQKGLLYVRNYGVGLDLPWEDVFQTNNKAEVEAYCRSAEIEFEWIGEDQLRTRQRCQVSATHPHTGDKVWFNQAHLFHVSRLPVEVREWLLGDFAPEDLPRNVYFADGSDIEPELLDEILKVYEQQMVIFPWRAGDVLLVDNMLTAHGRQPFTGKRRVVVGMSQPNVPQT